jgi:hypothetical protein
MDTDRTVRAAALQAAAAALAGRPFEEIERLALRWTEWINDVPAGPRPTPRATPSFTTPVRATPADAADAHLFGTVQCAECTHMAGLHGSLGCHYVNTNGTYCGCDLSEKAAAETGANL